ncbi:cytosolic protein [Seonamhaeicola sp. S2-3]|uniref:bacillithiol system redox-active protein YtxJ n=1 Tax=Seonamhaeicola sp. S2-3 TaxID=1936081 RepID=UPI000972A2AA|nr:bacillithiol system redox-active protein YtxJ [Seonamhaeicola sp. S2-3]APY12203.1 cytosolic protein [Seonamhaeicola sp. S2-3]
MGLLNKIFGGSSEPKEEKILPWIALKNLEQLNDIEEKSKTKAQVIFKHSTRCGISRMVMNQFVDAYNLTETDLDLYYLDLLNYRDVSNEVGYKFQVLHESPQILVIKNGQTVAHASHGAINEISLENYI